MREAVVEGAVGPRSLLAAVTSGPAGSGLRPLAGRAALLSGVRDLDQQWVGTTPARASGTVGRPTPRPAVARGDEEDA